MDMRKIILGIIVFVSVGADAEMWKGVLKVQGSELELIFEVKESDDRWNSTLTVPAQGVKGMAMDSTQVVGSELRIYSKMLNMEYVGMYMVNGYVGKYTQNGMTFDLNLYSYEEAIEERKRPQTPKEPYLYKTENVKFENRVEGNTLAGTLSLPRTRDVHHAVVLVSGSGAQNRDEELFGHKPFLVLADYLTRHGIAVLRYDDRNVGESAKADAMATTAMLALDAEAGVEYLRRRGYKQVGVIGHSEGGNIAFMLAGEVGYETRPDFVVSMAGCATSGADVLLSQQEYALRKASVTGAQKEAAMGANREIYELVLASESMDSELEASVRKILEKYVPVGMDASVARRNVERTLRQVLNPWMYYFLRYNPAEAIERVKVPILALNGSLDMQVGSDKHLEEIEKALKKAGNTNYAIKKFEGLNHLFQTAETGDMSEYEEIEETMAEEVMQTIVEWVKR